MQIIASLLSLAVVSQAIIVHSASREIDLGHTDMYVARTLFTIEAEGSNKFKFAIAKDFEENLMQITA